MFSSGWSGSATTGGFAQPTISSLPSRPTLLSFVKNYRQSPRKVRLLADLVRGKKINDAITTLAFSDKTAALPMKKALESALANAKNQGKTAENLVVSKIAVDKGTVMTKFMPRARGSASPINRRSSHIAIELSEK